VHAGGGLAAVGSQHVQRALDLTWHTLYGDDRAGSLVPGPAHPTIMSDVPIRRWRVRGGGSRSGPELSAHSAPHRRPSGR
jgi:hypothetical protein